MDYLTNYYKNHCEQLQEHINFLQNLLNEEDDKIKTRYVYDEDEDFVGPPQTLNYDVLPDDEIQYRTQKIEQYTKLGHRNKQISDAWNYISKNNSDPVTLNKIKNEFEKEIYKNREQTLRLGDEIWKKGKDRKYVDPRIAEINARINRQMTDSEEKPIS